MKSALIMAMLGVLFTACVAAPAPTSENCQNGTCSDARVSAPVQPNEPITVTLTPDKDTTGTQATATRAEWSRRQTLVPAVENVWLLTPPAWSTPLPTRAPRAPMTPPPPRTVALPSPPAIIRTGRLGVGPVHELSLVDKWAGSFQLFVSSLRTDGKTLVGLVIPPTGNESVAIIDLATGQVSILGEATAATEAPQVSGQYVVWSDGSELLAYDLQRKEKQGVKLSTRDIQVTGSRVLYRAVENGEWHIKGYDLATQKVFSITDDPGVHGQPLASKNWAVFPQVPKAVAMSTTWYYSTTLTALNLDTRERIQLGEIQSSSHRYVPDGLYAIDVPWVAWATGRLGDATMHLYNLETRIASTLSLPMCQSKSVSPSGYLSKLRISNGIVFFKCGDYPGQYLGYDIQENALFSIPIQQIKTEVDELGGWLIVGDRIVWVWNAYANGKKESHIYTAPILRQSSPYP